MPATLAVVISVQVGGCSLPHGASCHAPTASHHTLDPGTKTQVGSGTLGTQVVEANHAYCAIGRIAHRHTCVAFHPPGDTLGKEIDGWLKAAGMNGEPAEHAQAIIAP